MGRAALLGLCRLLLLGAASHANVEVVVIVVDPAAGAGSSSVPTVHAAAAAVRLHLQGDPSAGVRVVLAPGVHDVGASPLELGPDDSPASGATVTWTSLDPSAPATISAALPVTGWIRDPKRPGVLAAPIPAAASRHSALRHLWVGGARAFKPRYYPQPGSIIVLENSSVPLGSLLPYLLRATISSRYALCGPF